MRVRELMFTRVNRPGKPLTERHARIIRKLEDPDRQIELARRTVEENLSVEQLQKVMARATAPIRTGREGAADHRLALHGPGAA